MLEIARAAERKSMTELLRPVVEEYAARLAKDRLDQPADTPSIPLAA